MLRRLVLQFALGLSATVVALWLVVAVMFLGSDSEWRGMGLYASTLLVIWSLGFIWLAALFAALAVRLVRFFAKPS
jgi:hypothetical protein